MRKFRAIIETNKEPEDHEVLWYYKKVLYYYHNEGWEKFVANVDINIDNLPKEELLKLINDTITERLGNTDFNESVTNIVNKVINEKIGDFSPTAEKVSYSNNDYPNITNVKEALDELLYIEPKIISFVIKEAGVYEKGNMVSTITPIFKINKKVKTEYIQFAGGSNYKWEYNPPKIEVPGKEVMNMGNSGYRSDVNFTLVIIDYKDNTASATQSIKFVDYIYYGSFKNNTYTKLGKIPSTSNSFNVNIGNGENLWIFIPNSSSYKKIVFNEADSTSDFTSANFTNVADTKVNVAGIRYVSKNTGFGNIKITLQT